MIIEIVKICWYLFGVEFWSEFFNFIESVRCNWLLSFFFAYVEFGLFKNFIDVMM